MIILNGKELSAKIKDKIKSTTSSYLKTPILAVLTVGNDEASKIYVNNKKKASEYTGISFLHISYDDNISEEEIISKIKELNEDKTINGIIVQLPLPDKFNTDKIVNTIDPIKDVDGLTNNSLNIPCTPKGILEIFKHYNISLEGKNVVIVGRSNLVGKPLANLCLDRNATVTVCHSKTKDLSLYTRKADILIVATGKKWLIDKDMVRKGVIIIDVGINRERKDIYGDVNPNVSDKAYALTPVPGGVGPMTVVSLLLNTVSSYKTMMGIKDEE